MEFAGQQTIRMGPYELSRQLTPGVLGERWLVVHERTQRPHVLHRFMVASDRAASRRFIHILRRAESLKHAHILPIEAVSLDHRGVPFAITPYTGDQDGLMSLDRLLSIHNGYVSLEEARRALRQLLSAVEHAHREGVFHGVLGQREVLVDRSGCLFIELYGLARGLLAPDAQPSASERLEVRSVFEIGYQLLTGLRAEDPHIPPTRVLPELSEDWDGLFDIGLHTGFASAAHALSAVDQCSAGRPGRGLSRMRSALRTLLSPSR